MATTETLKHWKRRALKAEAENELISRLRQDEGQELMRNYRQIAAYKVAQMEAMDALQWAKGEQDAS